MVIIQIRQVTTMATEHKQYYTPTYVNYSISASTNNDKTRKKATTTVLNFNIHFTATHTQI